VPPPFAAALVMPPVAALLVEMSQRFNSVTVSTLLRYI